MKLDLQYVLETLRSHESDLRRLGVSHAAVFGSVARGEQTAASDVDVLVEFSESVGFFAFLDLEDFLTRTFGKKVDLVTKRALKPAVKDQILKDVVYV